MPKRLGDVHRTFIEERAALVRRAGYTDGDYLQEWPTLEEKYNELMLVLQRATVLKRERLMAATSIEEKMAVNDTVDAELLPEFEAACKGYIFLLKMFVS